MSRSPKYSFAQLGKKVRDQVHHDRDARHLRREAAAARRRDQLLAVARTEILQRYGPLATTLAGLGDEGLERGQALEDAVRHVREAASFTELAAAAGEFEDAERGIRTVRARAAVRSGGPADRIAALAAMIRDADAERGRYDPGDAITLDSRLAQLRSVAEPGDAEIDDLADRVRQHLDRVAAARAEHQEQRRRAAVRIELLAARLADLRADGQAAHVALRDGDRAGEAITMLRAQLARGELVDVLRLGAALERRVDAIEDDLDAVLDQIAERRTVLTSLVRALPAVGFSVDAGSVMESKDGAIGLRASRPGGDKVALIVEAEVETDESHRVLYASEAVQHEERTGHGSTACGSLLEIIDVLQESAGRDGIVMSPVTWEGRDGHRRPASNTSRRLSPPATESSRHEENPSWRP